MPKRLLVVASLFAAVLAASPAHADVANDPCDGAKEDDECASGRTCQESEDGGLQCDAAAADDDGCAVRALGSSSAAHIGAGAMFVAAVGMTLTRRRARGPRERRTVD